MPFQARNKAHRDSFKKITEDQGTPLVDRLFVPPKEAKGKGKVKVSLTRSHYLNHSSSFGFIRSGLRPSRVTAISSKRTPCLWWSSRAGSPPAGPCQTEVSINLHEPFLLIRDLHLIVKSLGGLTRPLDNIHIVIEVDSYGHYFRKVKSTVFIH